jgi:hypothetical protein
MLGVAENQQPTIGLRVVYDSTDGWRIESYGSDKILAREIGGTLDAEIAKGKSRTDILITSRDAIARIVCRGANTRPPAVRRRPKRIGADDNLGCQERVKFVDELPAVLEERGRRPHPRLPTHGPSGGVASGWGGGSGTQDAGHSIRRSAPPTVPRDSIPTMKKCSIA